MATDRTILRLGPLDHGRSVSSDEFAEAEFDEPWKYEREGGRLIVLAPSGEEHTAQTEPLRDHLGAYRLAHREVVDRVVSEAWIRVPDGVDRIADIGVYLVADAPAVEIPDRVPDLIFEVVSPGQVASDRDYIEKRSDYRRFGVQEYVIVDRFRRTATVLTLVHDRYDERILNEADSYESPLLPGLVIPLSEVF